MDPGGGDDGRELEEVFGEDQAGILQYLEEAIGEDFDQEFIEEFRNSDLFADVLRECGVPVGPESSNQSTSSRRPSINDSDGGTRRNLNQSEPPLEEITPPDVSSTIVTDPPTESKEQEPPQQSSSKTTAPPKRRKKKTEKQIISAPYVNSDESEDELENARSYLQKKLSDKLKIKPIQAPTHVSSSSSKTATKADNFKKKPEKTRMAGPGPKSKKPLTSPQSQEESCSQALGIGAATSFYKQKESSKGENSTNKFSSPQHQTKVKELEEHQRRSKSDAPSLNALSKQKELNIHLMKLRQTQTTILITPRLLDEIHQCEMKLRNACPACVNPKPLVGVTSRERQKNKLQNSRMLESQPEDIRRSISHQPNIEGPKRNPQEPKETYRPHKDGEKGDKRGFTSTGKSASKIIPHDKSPVKLTRQEGSPVRTSQSGKSPTKPIPRENSPVKKVPSPEKVSTKLPSPEKLTKIVTPEKSPTKIPQREKSPLKNMQRGKSPAKISSLEKSGTKLSSPEKSLSKSELHDKSPSKSELRDKSPSKSELRDKSPSKSELRDKSPSKSELRDKSPSKSELRDKSPSKSEQRDKSPSKAEHNMSPSKPLPPEKPATLIASPQDEKKRKLMTIDKLTTLNETLNKAKIKNNQSTMVQIKKSTAQAEKQVEKTSVALVVDLKQTQPLSEKCIDVSIQVSSSNVKNKEPTSPPTGEETNVTSITLAPNEKLEEERQSSALVNAEIKSIQLKSPEDISSEKPYIDVTTIENVNTIPSFEEELEGEKSLEGRIAAASPNDQVNDPSSAQVIPIVQTETNQSKVQSCSEVVALGSEEEKTIKEKNPTSEHVQNVNEEISIPDERIPNAVQFEAHVSPDAETVDVENSGSPSPDNVVDFASPPPSPNVDDSIDSSSPEIIGAKKSPTPDRIMSKKKNVIESSSDDGDHRRDDAETTDDTTPERKKSSDDEPMGNKKGVRFALPNPSIERKRDQDDYRSGKFGEFEMERQRKKDKRKGGRDKSGKLDTFEEFMKEKQLSSFRIPRKTSATSRKTETRNVVTPLTAIDVPKEKMQFERFRKGLSDKDKIERKERGEWTHRNRGGGDFHNEVRGGADQKFGNSRINREGGTFDRHRDDGRVVLLAPHESKQSEETAGISTPLGVEPEKDSPVPEPAWADDGEELGGGVSPDIEGGEATTEVENNESKVSKDKQDVSTSEISLEKVKTEPVDEIDNGKDNDEDPDDEDLKDFQNPEIPLKKIKENPFSVGVCMLLAETPKPDLPDVEVEKNLAEATVIKVAWFFSKADFDNSKESGSGDDWYKPVDLDESDDDGAKSDCSFHELLKFTQSEEDEVYLSLPKEKQKRKSNIIDECCGRQLLVSEYRSGPGDKFSNIFQLRGSGETAIYEKENFQARCNLCDILVIGKLQLANHVMSDSHKDKMSKAGLDNLKATDGKATDKHAETSKEDKKSETSKNNDQKVAPAESSSSEKKDKKRDDDHKNKKNEDKHSDKKRKRSKDRSSPEKSKDESGAEIGTTSTGLPIKIPAGAIPDKDKKRDSRDRPSRSRSPRHKRNRSRSPRHQSGRDRDKSPRRRSRSPHGGSSTRRRRSRSRSRDRARDRAREPVVRISRSPTKLRRRSTSTERVEKFLAKTQRRSRSPSNGYRKRHRPASPPPKTGVLPKKTNKEFHEKMALTLEGKWTDELETKWKMMEAEEAIFMEQFGEKSEKLKTTPESHPSYGEEWTAFWERRFQEIENEGKEDPEKYNFVPEWKEFWNKRLRELLDKEYEEGIKEIKLRNGLDIDTLQKLRNIQPEPVVIKINPEPTVAPLPVPRPVPPPCMPVGVPPPQIFMAQVPSITGTITPSSVSVSDMGDDMVAQAMSISDGGDVQPGSTKNIVPTVPSPTVTTVDVMSTWEKLKSGGVPPKQSNTSAPVPSPAVQQPLRSLSVTKSVDERSIADSAASIESYPFNKGMDVIQVLHYMTKLEDQLSFFAEKVKEYYKKAEELDLKKRNQSYTLLTDEDFVAMLFQIHDRFMAMIRAHILPKDVLDNLNIAVYYLKGILEHPDCQKRRPIIPSPPEIPPPKQDIQPTKHINVNDTFTRPTTSSSLSSHVKNPLQTLPDRKKKEIAMLMTDFLMNMGREDLSDTELKELVGKMLLQKSTSESTCVSNTARNPTPTATGRGVDMPSHNQNRDSDSSLRSIRFGENSELDPWRLPDRNVTKLFGTASFHAEGTAVPDLPNVVPNFRNPIGGGGPIRYGSGGEGGNSGWGRGQTFPTNDRDYMSSSSSGTGRHSPFSRRDFSGNPISANPYRDKAPDAPGSSRRPSHSRENIDGLMPVVTVGTTSKLLEVKRTLNETKRTPEIQMTQLTKYRTTRRETINVKLESVEKEIAYHIYKEENDEVQRSIGERPSRRESREQETVAQNSNLPPGILNMIMKERNSRLKQESEEVGEVVSDGKEESLYYRRQVKKKRRKKTKGHRSSSRRSSDDSDSDERKYAQDRGKERHKRRERRRKKDDRSTRKSSESPTRSDSRERRRTQSPVSDKRGWSERRSKSSSQDGKCRESKRRSRSSSLAKRKSSRVRRSRSGSLERTRSRQGSSRSYKRHRESRQEKSRSQTPDRSYRRESRRRYRSGDVQSNSGSSPIVLKTFTRRTSSRRDASDEENSRRGKRRNPSSIKSEVFENIPEPVTESIGRRRAPPRDSQLSEGEMWELSPEAPPQQSSSSYFRGTFTSGRNPTQMPSHNFYMNVPSPSASVNSGSSGYRRTKQRPQVTTVSVPNRSKMIPQPQVENWDTLSEVSSPGEEKKQAPVTNSFSAKFFQKIQEIAAEKAKVTSVSKTFWTQKEEDAKSLSSISSHDLSVSKKPFAPQESPPSSSVNPVSTYSEAPLVHVPTKGMRNYRVSIDDKEPGELSSSSADLEEI